MIIVKHFFRLLDIALGLLFVIGSIHVFWKIETQGYSCYNEPNRKLARIELTTAIGLLAYVVVRGYQYIKSMLRRK